MTKALKRNIFFDNAKANTPLFSLGEERYVADTIRYKTLAEKTRIKFDGTVLELREYYKSLWITSNEDAIKSVKKCYQYKIDNATGLKSQKVIDFHLAKAEQVKSNFPMFFEG